jgi:glyoxylate/hydroxypyruvate reductase A
MTTLLLITYPERVAIWREALQVAMPELEVRVWPDIGPAEEVSYVLCWMPEPGLFARLPKLRGIFSLGAGADHILRDKAVPADVPVVRMVDPSLGNAITQYILLAVLRQHRNIDAYREQQARGVWEKIGISNLHPPRVGMLGLGELGARAARMLADLGYPVAGWSRSAKQIDKVETHHGRDGLDAVVRRSDILVSVLPSTPATEGLLDAALFARLPQGAHVINLGRGEHVVEADLVAALDSGHLSGATLDVFRQEPLPAEHPFWRHPKVIVTPHDGGDTIPRTAAKVVTDNIARIEAGDTPIGLVDRHAGY